MQRDLRIDTIRGVLLVIMTLNHTHSVLLYKGWIQRFVVSPLGYVSAAEGFIFVSGLLIGLIYRKYSGGTFQLFKKNLSRAKTICFHHLVPLFSLHILAFFVTGLAFSWKKWLSFYYLAKRTLIAEALLLYQPEIFDILPMYVLFVLAAPFLILLCKKRWGYVVVLLLSFGLWGLGQKFDPICMLNETLFPGHRCGWFNVLVWQLPFVLGLVLGISKPDLRRYRFFRSMPFFIVIFIITFIFFLLRHQMIDLSFSIAASVSKKNLAWLRIVNLLSLITLLGMLLSKLPKRAHIPGLVFIGQHSLQVFTFHVLLIYFLTPFHETIVSHFNAFTYPLFMLLVGTSLLLPAAAHDRWRVIKRKLRAVKPLRAVQG